VINKGGTMQEMIKSSMRTAADRINEAREPAARQIENAAAKIHESADQLPGGPRVQRLAHLTGEKLGATAKYIRSHELNHAMSDVGRVVRQNPRESMLAAVAAGFLAGILLKRR
jgi:ElaB/YqjD/DUF883 family membrane-anchored ribosome-binding protein